MSVTSYKNFPVVPIPTTIPTQLEVQNTAITSQTRNPFSGQTQQFSWGVTYKELSVALPPMTESQFTYWYVFLTGLTGTVNVFAMTPAFCIQYPMECAITVGWTGSASGSSIVLGYGSSVTNDAYKDETITIGQGTGIGQSRTITGYSGSTKTATVDSAWSPAPDTTSVYIIPRYWRLKSNTSKWAVKSPGGLYYCSFECTECIA
jgi:hypothetical protein